MNAFLASIGYQRWILPVLLIIPLAGAAVIWFQGARREAGDGDEVVNGTASSPRGIALLAFAIEFVVSIGLWWSFDPTNAAWQSVIDMPWIDLVPLTDDERELFRCALAGRCQIARRARHERQPFQVTRPDAFVA